MSKDLSKYNRIIEQFRGQVFKTDFEAKYNAATKKLPTSDRFLLKMEVKRLAQPCTRLVDLRGLVDGECKMFEYDGKTHFLDDVAIQTFKESIESYGSYTFGVYEAVKNTDNNFRVIYQREKSQVDATQASGEQDRIFDKTQYPADVVSLGPYFNRKEERMNFAISVKIQFNDNDILLATTSDMSIDGCKVRLTEKQEVKKGQTVIIQFVGLEQEFQFGKQNEFEYIVRNLQVVDKIQLIGLERVYQDGQEKDGFKQFLKGFIQGNKRRYKINLDNSISAIKSRSYQQYILPKINELPIFIQSVDGKYQPTYALTGHNNQALYQYWQDERQFSTIDCLLTQERIARLRMAKKIGQSLLVYSFIHENKGQQFFYTADNKQLEQDKLFMRKFIAFAASKDSFAVTEIKLFDVDREQIHATLTLSNSLGPKDQYLMDLPSDDVYNVVDSLPYCIVAQDLTCESLIEEYKQYQFSDIDKRQLKAFGHKRHVENKRVESVGISFLNQRSEPRFRYKTPATIEAGGVQWHGHSEDFSMSGLKLVLDREAILKRGDVVKLSLPNLQKVTNAYDLSQLPYEVVRINKKRNIINLKVYVEQHHHIGRSFFKLLISKNRDKLETDEYALTIPGLNKALINVYSSFIDVPNVLVQTSGSRYKAELIVANDETSNFISVCRGLSDHRRKANLFPILSHNSAMETLSTALKRLQPADLPVNGMLYVSIDTSLKSVEKAVITKFDTELSSDKLRHMFIATALKRGQLFCLQTKLSRVDSPNMDFLNPELSYIGSYAIHRGKQLEQDIWSVAGVVELIDTTKEALLRHQMYVAEQANK